MRLLISLLTVGFLAACGDKDETDTSVVVEETEAEDSAAEGVE